MKDFFDNFLIMLDLSIKVIMVFLFCFFGLGALIFTFLFVFRVVVGPMPPDICVVLLGITWGITLLIYCLSIEPWIEDVKEDRGLIRNKK